MLKNTLLLISIILVSTAIIFSAYVIKDKDLCCGLAFCKQMTNICSEDSEKKESTTVLMSSKGTQFTINNVKSEDTLTNGTEVSGVVKGSWYFEGEFPVVVLNSTGNVLATIPAVAQGEWMTQDEVPFTFKLDLPIIQENSVVLLFQRSNPSGLEVNDDSVSLPIKVTASNEQTEVKVYFPNAKLGSSEDCGRVFPVTRIVPKVAAIARVSMEQLFSGPTYQEIQDGYFTNVNEGVSINALSIANGVATIDLSEKLEEGVGGSCMVESIRAQIEETLKQFPTVNEVRLSVDGRTGDMILQP